MSLDVVRAAIYRLKEDGLLQSELSVLWHAGEPLVAGKQFYEQAVTEIDRILYGICKVTHSIQTNATLIDEEWCHLFTRLNIRIGVSIDGTPNLNDLNRKTRSGLGTHHLAERGMKLLQKHGVPFHVIAVVSANTLESADEFFDYFIENHVQELGCNFDEVEGQHVTSSLHNSEAQYSEFLERAMKRFSNPSSPLRIRELITAANLVISPLPHHRVNGHLWPINLQVMPLAMISVAWNGDFSTFSPELLGQKYNSIDTFMMGNVLKLGYLDSLKTQPYISVWEDIKRGVESCAMSCKYFSYCGGGSPANKFYENGTFNSTETLYCRLMHQTPFEVTLSHLELILSSDSSELSNELPHDERSGS